MPSMFKRPTGIQSMFKKPTVIQSVFDKQSTKYGHTAMGLSSSGLGYFPLFGTNQSTFQTIGYYILYALAAGLIIFIILLLLGVPIGPSYFDFRSSSAKVSEQALLFWDKNITFTNLITPETALQNLNSTLNTCMVDCLLFNTRSFNNIYIDGEGPYRHLFHRGSNELAFTTIKGAMLGGCGARGSSADLPEYGLPSIMNPGVFLDPNLNDILVFVDTSCGDRESLRIPNIPLDIPFRIAIVLNDRVLEVYINCRLETTKILKSSPAPAGNMWYGLAGAASAEAQVQNLRIWNFPINASDMKDLCPVLPDFTNNKRIICDSAEAPPPSSPSIVSPDRGTGTTKSEQPDLGFLSAVSTCNR